MDDALVRVALALLAVLAAFGFSSLIVFGLYWLARRSDRVLSHENPARIAHPVTGKGDLRQRALAIMARYPDTMRRLAD